MPAEKFLVREKVRTGLRKLPPPATIGLLRHIFSLPAKPARLLLHDILKPRKEHQPWMRKVTWESNWKGYWFGENIQHLDHSGIAKRAKDADIVIFYVHGGGFRLGTPTMYTETFVNWVKMLKEQHGLTAVIMSVKYRLAPEHKYPGPVEDVVGAYEYLVRDLGVSGSKIIMGGDSAGGALALETLFLTNDPSAFVIETEEGVAERPTEDALPRPAGLILISPLVTDQTNAASWITNAKYDYITQATARVIRREYLPKDMTTSIPFLDMTQQDSGFSDWMPKNIMVVLGGKEVMLDDGLTFARKMKGDGMNVELVVEDELVHDWFLVREVVKDKSITERTDRLWMQWVIKSLDESRNEPLDDFNFRHSYLSAVIEEKHYEDLAQETVSFPAEEDLSEDTVSFGEEEDFVEERIPIPAEEAVVSIAAEEKVPISAQNDALCTGVVY